MNQTLRTLRVVVLILLVCAAPLILAALVGSSPPAMVWLDAPGWSRARLVATTRLDEAVPVVVDERGGVYLFLVQAEGAARRVQVIALDRGAHVTWEQTFEVPVATPTSPRLLLQGNELVLLWLSNQQLYTARLATSGEVLATPAAVSGEARVGAYAAASGAAGELAVWFAGTGAAPGLYSVQIDAAPAQSTLVDPTGTRPGLQFDSQGTLHAVWLASAAQDEADILHAAYPAGVYRPDGQRRIATVEGFESASSADGPWLGLDTQHGYLLWTTYITSGMNTGRFLSHYLAFPLDQQGQVGPQALLTVPVGAQPVYEELPGVDLVAGARVPLAASPSQGSAPSAMVTNGAPEAELAAVCEVRLSSGAQNTGRICALFFQEGAPSSYQLLSDGRRSAFTPAVASDSSQHLYLTWREIQGAESSVYFASTAPDITASLRTLSLDDVVRILNDIIFGMLAGVILSPFTTLLWLAPALLLLAPFWLVRRVSERELPLVTLLSLLVALAAYWVSKMTILSQALSFVPFSTWVPALPEWLALPLQIGVPLLIAALALLVAWDQTYRRGRPSAALFVLIYGAIDSVGTMAIYGAQLFG